MNNQLMLLKNFKININIDIFKYFIKTGKVIVFIIGGYGQMLSLQL